jgi:hypothetical protein
MIKNVCQKKLELDDEGETKWQRLSMCRGVVSSMRLAVNDFTGYLGLEQIANCTNYENHLPD